MREPIHNEVAQAFLVQLLQRLARFENVQEALIGACQVLKLKQNLTYPSAYMVPSLFRHPDSVPYRVQPVGWRAMVRQWRPRRREALVVSAIALLSLIAPVHYWLIDHRVMAQAIYRDKTGQVGATSQPPVVLIQVDPDTFPRWGAKAFNPIDRALLADILDGLTEQGATVIGVDYLLDLEARQSGNDPVLKQSIGRAVEQNQAWHVFVTRKSPGGPWHFLHKEAANSDWVLQGDGWLPFWHLPNRLPSVDYGTPFSYQLALAHRLRQRASTQDIDIPLPGSGNGALQQQVQRYLNDHDLGLPTWVDAHPLTRLSGPMGQRWLQPLLDFSIPPGQVYQAVPAWQLLEAPEEVLDTQTLQDQVVIVAAGGYDTADDNLPRPPAMNYWEQGLNSFTGGEAHAYATHHWLTRRLVIPIPDLAMILVAALVGKGLTVYLANRPRVNPLRLGAMLAVVTAGYGLASLQLYISAAVMLPWLLPSLTVWLYTLPLLKEKTYEQH
ncbi:MAG: CHASE2 domain-containing protein [Nodosilinea sp.]